MKIDTTIVKDDFKDSLFFDPPVKLLKELGDKYKMSLVIIRDNMTGFYSICTPKYYKEIREPKIQLTDGYNFETKVIKSF